MKLPDHLHKGLLVDIIHRGALNFIESEKDDHQDKDKDEDSKTDASLLSSD